jgi:hypothetical protein
MLSNTTKARLGAKGTVAVARHPTARRIALKAGVPTAKVVAKRQARNKLEPVGAAARRAGSMIVVYGPIVADVLGFVEEPKPKPRRRAPLFAALAAAAAFLILARRRS